MVGDAIRGELIGSGHNDFGSLKKLLSNDLRAFVKKIPLIHKQGE
jgi:hypothetical protein